MTGDSQTRHCFGINSRLARAIIAFLPLFPTSGALAVGLGGYEVQSSLGQALRMVVQVTARADEQIDPSCFRVNPFSVAGDGLPQLTSAQMTLERRGNEQRLVITSPRAIMDPIVRIAIDVGCDTTLRREITLLLDPPSATESLPQTPEARPAGVPIAAAPRAPQPGAADDASRGAGTAATGPTVAPAPRAPRPAERAAAPSTPRADPSRAAATSAPPLMPRRETVGPSTAPPPSASPAPPPAAIPRPPRTVRPSPPDTQLAPQVLPPRPLPQATRDRLSISTSPLPLESYGGATLTPRLNLATTLGDRSRQPMSENAMSLLRQKQARLRAASPGEDLPSLEAELVVLQKRTAEMQRQLESVMGQMTAMREAGAKAPAAGAAPAPAVTPSTPAAALAPTIASSAAPAAVTAPVVSAVDGAAATPVRSAAESEADSSSLWNDARLIYAGPLALIILLLIVGFALWIRRERDDARRADRWNAGSYATGGPAVPAPPPPRTVFGGSGSSVEPPLLRPERVGPAVEQSPVLPDAYNMPMTPFSSGQAAQEVGVSDLAKATEKASVFVTLGRPEQAIDVLRDHIDHEPKSSPMAWLMLLDLYRQTDRYDDFSEIAQRFHLEFNAVTPDWNQAVAPLHDDGLAAFPYLVARIRDQWPTAEGRAFIEELLYDNRGGSRIGFSISSFRDLLLLHSMIDEHLAARETTGSIDPSSGSVIDLPDPPEPPAHLAAIWATATPERPPFAPIAAPPGPGFAPLSVPPLAARGADKPALNFDVGLLSESPDRSTLETSYPIIAEAVVSRWGKPGLAAYLSNLIRSSADRGPGLTNEALAELILLHDVAIELGEPEPTFSIV